MFKLTYDLYKEIITKHKGQKHILVDGTNATQGTNKGPNALENVDVDNSQTVDDHTPTISQGFTHITKIQTKGSVHRQGSANSRYQIVIHTASTNTN